MWPFSKKRYDEKKKICLEIIRRNTRDYAFKMNLDIIHYMSLDNAYYWIFEPNKDPEDSKYLTQDDILEFKSGAIKFRKRAMKYKKLENSWKLHFIRKSKLEKVLKKSPGAGHDSFDMWWT